MADRVILRRQPTWQMTIDSSESNDTGTLSSKYDTSSSESYTSSSKPDDTSSSESDISNEMLDRRHLPSRVQIQCYLNPQIDQLICIGNHKVDEPNEPVLN